MGINIIITIIIIIIIIITVIIIIIIIIIITIIIIVFIAPSVFESFQYLPQRNAGGRVGGEGGDGV